MLSERLADQIQSLQQHPHISSISALNDYTIKMNYSPSETTSVYKDKIYGLMICLPETYPDDPPALKFLDPIYHLNINYESGEVRMAILEEDWSPFLSLTSVIQSLDYVMEEPQKGCPYASQILHQYENDREAYLHKVLGSIDYSIEAELCASGDHVVEGAAEASAQENFSANRQYANKSSILVQELRESMMEMELGSPKKPTTKREKNNQVEGIGNLKESLILQEKQKSGQPARSIEKEHKKNKNFTQNKSPEVKKLQNSQPLSHKNATLHNINETINIFIQEIEEIEQQLAKAKTPAILAMLKARQDSQFQMMKEVVEISETLKKGLVKKIKEDINKL